MLALICLSFLILQNFILTENCGVSPNIQKYKNLFQNGNPLRILGGFPAKDGDWPWLTYFHGYDEKEYFPYICTGSIIHQEWVVTAKHCEPDPNDVIIYGSVNYQKGKKIKVAKSFLFNATSKTIVNQDIALIKLVSPIKFSDNVHSICLAENISSKIGTQEAVAGWGINLYTHKLPLIANENTVPLKSSNYCQYNVFKNELCAGSIDHGTTGGDSGGPMMAIKNNRWVLHGITSRGGRTKVQNRYEDFGTYTDVTHFCDWIKKTTNSAVECQTDEFFFENTSAFI